MNDELKLRPYAVPERRQAAHGDWWALGELEGAIRNPDGSRRTFTVEVGLSLEPHGDIAHCEREFWRLVGEKLPLIAEQMAGGGWEGRGTHD